MNQIKTLSAAIIAASALIASGCGSDSGSNYSVVDPDPADPPVQQQTTTYSVAVSDPDFTVPVTSLSLPQQLRSLFSSNVYAAPVTDLELENFAIVIVNTAGEVVEEITITADDITVNEDGTYEIVVPGVPQLNCLIVVDLDGPVQVVLEQPLPVDVLYTPTTSDDVEVDVATTAAFSSFLETLDDEATFAELGFEISDAEAIAAVEQLVVDIQEAYEELIAENPELLNSTSVEDLLAAVEETVEAIVQSEVENIVNQTEGDLAELFADGAGGLSWYEAENEDGDLYFERGTLSVSADTFQEFDFETREWGAVEEYDGSEIDGIMLTSEGWANLADYVDVTVNDDGSVNFIDKLQDSHVLKASATSIVGLEGLNIRDRLSVEEDTASIKFALSKDAVFSAGAKGYELQISATSDIYSLWYEEVYDDGGTAWCWGYEASASIGDNCEYAGVHNVGPVATLAELVSDVAGSGSEIRGIEISWYGGQQTIVELVSGGTANYYQPEWSEVSDDYVYNSIGAGSWTEETVEGQALIVVPVPEAVLNADDTDFDDDEGTFIFAKPEGDSVVRIGNFIAADTVVEAGEIVYNQQASTDIDAAIKPVYLDTLELSSYDYQGNGVNICDLNSNWQEGLGEYDGFGGPSEYDFGQVATGNIGAITDRAYSVVVVPGCRLTIDLTLDYYESNDTFGIDSYERVSTVFTAAMLNDKVYQLGTDGDADFIMFNADGSGEWGGYNSSDVWVTDTAFTWVIENGALVTTLAITGAEGDSGESYDFTATEVFSIVGGYYEGGSSATAVGFQTRNHFINPVWAEMGVTGTASVPGTPVLKPEQGDLWDTIWIEAP